MKQSFIISSSPHFRGKRTTGMIMGGVLLCLLPAVVASGVIFGLRALLLVAVCASSCVVLEYFCRLVMKRQQTAGDLSAAVTGVLLAMTLPHDISIFMALFGCVCAIVVIKQFFGGIGQNFINPAIGARVIMLVSFPEAMTTFSYDGVTSATPLATGASFWDLFLGTTGGSLGETCAVALLVGGAALVALRIIKPIIPVFYVGTVAIMSFLLGQDVLLQVLGGGLLLGAFFMATDYTTSPLTDLGKIIYAVGCGLLTCVIRFYANLPEGVSYAIMLMNIITPLIDRVIVPKAFGAVKKAKKEAGK